MAISSQDKHHYINQNLKQMKQDSNLHRCYQKRKKKKRKIGTQTTCRIFPWKKSSFLSNQDFQGFLGKVGSWIQVNTRVFRFLPWRLISWKHRRGTAIICLLPLLSSHQDVSLKQWQVPLKPEGSVSISKTDSLCGHAKGGWFFIFCFTRCVWQQFSLQSQFSGKAS